MIITKRPLIGWRHHLWPIIISKIKLPPQLVIVIIPEQFLCCWHHDSESLREFAWFMWWMQNSARRLATFGPSWWTWAIGRLSVAVKLRPPSPFIITQIESQYLFDHPTEGRRLSECRLVWLKWWWCQWVVRNICRLGGWLRPMRKNWSTTA